MEQQAPARPARRELRLWPGLAIAATVLVARYVAPAVVPTNDTVAMAGVLTGMIGGLLLLVWWLFFSRAAWVERLGAVAAIAAALVGVAVIGHRSIATGAMGMLVYVLAMPLITIAFAAWAYLTRGLADRVRRVTMVAATVGACVPLLLLRTGGFTGNFDHDFAWRWTPTAEERLLAADGGLPPPTAAAAAPVAAATSTPSAGPVPETAHPAPATTPAVADAAAAPRAAAAPSADAPAAATPASPTSPAVAPAWPGFRGLHRDGVAEGVRIATDWSATPPLALWKRAVGPGWSSFAVAGDRIYTQEQRGEDEVVACYRLTTGEPIWMHRDATRFWESNAGAGPRATPVLHGGRVYAMGAKGTLNALDAATGAVAWSRNAATDTGAALPMWGFSGSPIVSGDALIVSASGALAAYDLRTGRLRWKSAVQGGGGYSSPQLATIDGRPQILLINSMGLAGLSPDDGTLLWSHAWKGFPMVQPAMTTDGDVLAAANDSDGLRRLAVRRGASGWTATERWTSRGLKPYFNDFVVHEGHAYGFDGAILSCVDLADGTRKWKGGRYGNGQMVLLPEQDALLVLSEEGDIALVQATPEGYRELGKVPGIDGKTWNHPVVVGDILLARNGEQMAAFRLPAAGR